MNVPDKHIINALQDLCESYHDNTGNMDQAKNNDSWKAVRNNVVLMFDFNISDALLERIIRSDEQTQWGTRLFKIIESWEGVNKS